MIFGAHVLHRILSCHIGPVAYHVVDGVVRLRIVVLMGALQLAVSRSCVRCLSLAHLVETPEHSLSELAALGHRECLVEHVEEQVNEDGTTHHDRRQEKERGGSAFMHFLQRGQLQ